MRASSRAGPLFKYSDGGDGTEEYDTQQCETVGVAHIRGLRSNAIADRDHCAVRGAGSVWRVVCHKMLLQLRQPALGRGLQHGHIGIEDERMVLLALGEEHFQRRCANRSAEVAQHVEKFRRTARLGRRNAHHGDRGQRRHDDRLAEGPRHGRWRERDC
jgi:hypothetical protein